MRTLMMVLVLCALAMASWQTEYLYPEGSMDPSGTIEWYQTQQGLTAGYYYWYDGTITVGHTDYSGRAWPHTNGVCIFRVPHFESPGAVPICTLFFYQASHTEDGEGETLLVNSWFNDSTAWPPATYGLRFTTYWETWNSTDTVAVDVIHADDGWYKIPLYISACANIADSAALSDPPAYKFFWTGWVYHGSVDDAITNVAGYSDDEYRPYIKVRYDDEP